MLLEFLEPAFASSESSFCWAAGPGSVLLKFNVKKTALAEIIPMFIHFYFMLVFDRNEQLILHF